MNRLNQYINEKLKIGINTKIGNILLDRIIKLFTIPESVQNEVLINGIKDWINGKLPHNKYKIEEVVPIAYPITIDILIENGVKKEITNEYAKHNSIENCEMCEYEYDNSYDLYEDDEYEIRYNENILSFINKDVEYYALYLYNEKTFYTDEKNFIHDL